MMQARRPYFSIVIATLNSARTLERCLDSIDSQHFRDFEILMVDGGSSDGTQAIAAARGNHIAYFVSEPDAGIYDAWNKAVAVARGEWLCFLGSDDYLWNPDILTRYHALIAGERLVNRFIYGRVAKIRDTDVIRVEGEAWPRAARRWRTAMTVPHVASMHHYSLFEGARFDPKLRIAGDYKFLRQELLDRGATFFPEIVAGVQIGGISSDLRYAIPYIIELRGILRETGATPLGWYLQFAKTACSVAVRRLLKR
jgi:glycosyltransferase involved in cell wall biosynthesis